ncbi:MAG: 3-keto-5-aminohexanoate cleavage protein [Thermodesulfobacteriota bacterium]|nr:3-keto-5-aminohexanoate cleavage protein [Thermodesulfobacteriota bacterium]
MTNSELKKEEFLQKIFGGKALPFIVEPKEPTMDKKLIINIATTGAFIGKEDNPNQALYPEQIARAVIESYQEGAAMWHVHTRDDRGFPSLSPDLAIEIEDMVLKECPDIITSVSVWAELGKSGSELIGPFVEPLYKKGKRYIQTAVIPGVTLTVGPLINIINQDTLTDIVKYLQSKEIKPEFQAFNFEAIENVRRWLIEPGLLRKPYFINAIAGTHAGVFYQSPTTPYSRGISYLINMIEDLPPDTVKGATIGGRNWLPMVVVAIIMGVDCVRIGMEDAVFMYPHKDEKIKRTMDVVKKVASIARELGREIATPSEARKILDLS